MEDFKYKLHDLQEKNPENLKCFDCGQPHPTWCSIDFGIYICLTCSGIHRSIGVHISFVRSMNLDNWSEIQYRRMSLGGNHEFKQFIDDSFFELDVYDRYFTTVSAEYRERLTCKLKGIEFDPSLVVVPKKPAPRVYKSNPSLISTTSNQNISESLNGFVSSVSNQVYSSVTTTIETVSQNQYTQQSIKKLYDWFSAPDTKPS